VSVDLTGLLESHDRLAPVVCRVPSCPVRLARWLGGQGRRREAAIARLDCVDPRAIFVGGHVCSADPQRENGACRDRERGRRSDWHDHAMVSSVKTCNGDTTFLQWQMLSLTRFILAMHWLLLPLIIGRAMRASASRGTL